MTIVSAAVLVSTGAAALSLPGARDGLLAQPQHNN